MLEVNKYKYSPTPFSVIDQALTEISKRRSGWPADERISLVGTYWLNCFVISGKTRANLYHGDKVVMSWRVVNADHQT